jgi:hypothetical protein
VTFYETPISEDQRLEELPGGTVRLTATVNDTHELRAWLRGFGSRIAVLSPAPFLDS